MKKLFTLLTMLALGISGMWADDFTPDANAEYTLECCVNNTSDHYGFIGLNNGNLDGRSAIGTRFKFEATSGGYYIKVVDANKYFNWNNSDAVLSENPSTVWVVTSSTYIPGKYRIAPSDTPSNQGLNNNEKSKATHLKIGPFNDASNACSHWTLTEYSYSSVPGKGYKLKMEGTNLYVKFRTSYTENNAVNATLLDDRGTIFKIESDGSGRYRFKWCNEYMKNVGSYSWNTGHGSNTDNATWYLEAATGDNTYYMKKGVSGNVYFGNDQATPAVGQFLYTDQSTSKRNIKWILEEVPLLPETSTSSNPKYYTIENARGYCYAQYAGDNTNMALVSSRLASKANAFWFEAVAEDNLPTGVMAVKIHNAATNKCVASTNRFTDDGITWYLKADVYTGGASAAINSNSTTWNNNSYGWNNKANGNTQIANWASTDICSAWWIERLSDDDWSTIYSNELTNNIQPFVDNPGNGYFQINPTNATSLSAMISQARSDDYVSFDEYTELNNQLYNNFMRYPTTGYYRIKNNKYNNYMTYGQPSSYSVGLIATSNSDDAASVVKLTGSRGTYNLSVQGLNIQSQTNANVAFPGTTDTGVDFTFNISSPGIVSITNGDSYVDSNKDGSLHETNWAVPAIVNWQASSDPSKWIVEDATSCTVTMNGPVNSYYYATLCVPFDVTINDATAYTLAKSESGNYLVPTEVTDNKVPAGTPVLLKGTNATATATINTGSAFNDGSPLTCALTGTYVAKTIVGSSDYVLGKKDGKVGFYHWNSNNLGANRAYLEATTDQARGFVLNFDDEATGIVAPIGETEEETTIYNLSGQRLNKMQKGINIVNGKKVLF